MSSRNALSQAKSPGSDRKVSFQGGENDDEQLK